ncbi:MAG TPA: hypothetical protein P5232_00050 [Candidatus Moranbacteria bacterium]|nr:hypothetical protein [Candidatus Moranbacteria bacterium]
MIKRRLIRLTKKNIARLDDKNLKAMFDLASLPAEIRKSSFTDKEIELLRQAVVIRFGKEK